MDNVIYDPFDDPNEYVNFNNRANLLPSRIPTDVLPYYYDGAFSIIVTNSIKPDGVSHEWIYPSYGAKEPSANAQIRLEYFDLNHEETTHSNNNKMNTWLDFFSWPNAGVAIENPPVKENYVDLPGGNGSLDFTELLTGYPLYENRTGSIAFELDPYRDGASYESVMQTISARLHGNHMYMLLCDEIVHTITEDGEAREYLNYQPWYYEGRVSVSGNAISDMFGTWNLEYNLKPYKKLLWKTAEDWVWDAFDFDECMDYQLVFKDQPGSSNTNREVDIGSWIGTMPTVPEITIEATEIPDHPDGLESPTELGMFVQVIHGKGDRIVTHTTGWIFLQNGTHKDPRFVMRGSGIFRLYDFTPEKPPIAEPTVAFGVYGKGSYSINMEIGVI